jgi:toxin FitB
MILLDTNVLSEFMRPKPADQVVSWLDAQPAHTLYISAVNQAEIELGLALMPSGRRQAGLAKAVRAMFDEDFVGRCLPFDASAAILYARVVADRARMGRPISVEDAQIAAIALVHEMRLASRNTSDFVHIRGLHLVDPWSEGW